MTRASDRLAPAAKRTVKALLRRHGWELERYRGSPLERLVGILHSRGVDLVIDVGANTGQFGTQLRGSGYAGRIVSFEPSRVAHAALCTTAAKHEAWVVAPRVAVGDSFGKSRLNISRNSVSSSLLDILPGHTEAAPRSAYVATEEVDVATLDSCMYLFEKASRAFLKIDTQGYEAHVLRGAANTLTLCSGVQVELSLAELYEGQGDFVQLLEFVSSLGFCLWDVDPEFFDPVSRRLLQVNATFLRQS